jgi:MFS family permease
MSAQSPAQDTSNLPWFRQLTGYHWFVFIIASAAWFFDCLDQRLFSLARIPALSNLMGKPPTDTDVQAFGKVVTAAFLIGWGIGGMIFGALGDRFGRAKMLTVTVLIYSAFTGLSYFSFGRIDFTIFRFLTGLGVGGVFGLAVALIAETVPAGARTQALGMLQVLSTIGNVAAGFTKMGIDALEAQGTIASGTGWRFVFLVGAVPAFLVIFTAKFLKEPEPWLKLKAEGRLPTGNILGSYGKLFRQVKWRRNLVVGALIASTGVIGLWAIGEYAVDLQRTVFKTYYEGETPVAAVTPIALTPEMTPEQAAKAASDAQAAAVKARDVAVKSKVDSAINKAYLLNMLGAAAGMWLFTMLANATGRRLAFFVGFTASLVVTVFVYWKMSTPTDAMWMMPLMGAAQLGPFAGFAIYLPELFPSSLRSTGTSFCYNLGRFAAAAGSFFSAYLTTVFANYASPLPLRYSAMVMCSLFLIGLLTLPFAPETKGKPLPTDDDNEKSPPKPETTPAAVPAGKAA